MFKKRLALEECASNCCLNAHVSRSYLRALFCNSKLNSREQCCQSDECTPASKRVCGATSRIPYTSISQGTLLMPFISPLQVLYFDVAIYGRYAQTPQSVFILFCKAKISVSIPTQRKRSFWKRSGAWNVWPASPADLTQ